MVAGDRKAIFPSERTPAAFWIAGIGVSSWQHPAIAVAGQIRGVQYRMGGPRTIRLLIQQQHQWSWQLRTLRSEAPDVACAGFRGGQRISHGGVHPEGAVAVRDPEAWGGVVSAPSAHCGPLAAHDRHAR